MYSNVSPGSSGLTRGISCFRFFADLQRGGGRADALLPKIILDEFVGDRNITKIIICVAVMAISAIFICVVEKITETLGFRLSHLQNHVRIERASKMAELDMAQVESPAVHDLSALAAEVNNRGTINQVTNRVMGLFSAIPMLITTIIILAEVNLWLVPISVVFAVASVIVSAHIEKRVFENHMYSETLFRAENYPLPEYSAIKTSARRYASSAYTTGSSRSTRKSTASCSRMNRS